MKNNILKIITLSLVTTLSLVFATNAAILDPTIPPFDANFLTLDSNGTATFVAPTYSGIYKRFDLQLLKRVTTVIGTTTTYTYKTQGSVKHAEVTDDTFDFTFTSTGYYQFQIRGVNLDGNYGEWRAIYDNSTWAGAKDTYPGVAVSEDDISTGSSSSSGVGSWSDYYYGPGVMYQGYNPYGYQQGVIGPNGQVYYYNNNGQYSTSGQYYNPYQSQYQNPQVYPSGAAQYPQVQPPYGAANPYQYNGQIQNGQVQNGLIDPNYYNGQQINNGQSTNIYTPGTNTGYATPQISQGLEIGWHIDNNGRFYYQGNGVVLKGTWYLIDGSYYRFSENGYMMANQWFKDNATGYWYYLGGDGRMLTGWQCINGTWYYFKPENGNGYGTMYRNATLLISDGAWGTGYYAFDSNGATVMNAWYGGFYYGRDGKRTN